MAATKVKSSSDAAKYINEVIKKYKVVVFSKSYCPYSRRAKDLLKKLNADIFVLELDELPENEGDLIQGELKKQTNQSTVPNIFINGKHVGGSDDAFKLHDQGKLKPLLNAKF